MRKIMFVFGMICFFLAGSPLQAGVFSTPQFIPEGKSAIGFEPELILTSGAGLGGNLRYTYGASYLNNATFIIGTGGGPRKFRTGGNFTFDFFPDEEGQPGIGIAFQSLYYRLKVGGMLEVGAIPYLHKAFISNGAKKEKGKESGEGTEIAPYIAVPVGLFLAEGIYTGFSALVVGTSVKNTEIFRTFLELGVAISHTETYLSGGIVFYP